MATQGLVSIKQQGVVRMKIVAGCNGMKAPEFADVIRKLKKVPTIKAAYKLAKELHFGCSWCLVVLTRTAERHETGEDLDPRYRSTFQRSRFNPRWEHGIADYTEVVDL